MIPIEVKGVRNMRDLGGYTGENGKKIKSGRLIRSGHLGKANKKALNKFVKDYNVKVEVDFRTERELKEKPAPKIEGVKYYNLPALDEQSLGITTEKGSLEKMLSNLVKNNPSIEEYMAKMYCEIAFSDYTLPKYKKFIEILLNNKTGAAVFHCSQGKDRAGLGAVIILMILGTDRETIVKDYMLTAAAAEKKIKAVKFIGKLKRWSAEQTDFLAGALGVREEYIRSVFKKIDSVYGSDYLYLKKAIGLSDDDIEKFKEMYLEN